jgi:hypothetical protein
MQASKRNPTTENGGENRQSNTDVDEDDDELRADARLFEVAPERVERFRQQLRAAGVDVDAARRVERMQEGAGSWWPDEASEAERRYLEVRGSAYKWLGAGDYSGLDWGGGDSR